MDELTPAAEWEFLEIAAGSKGKLKEKNPKKAGLATVLVEER